MIQQFLSDSVHPAWYPILEEALAELPEAYLAKLQQEDTWLPGQAQMLNAFSLPLSKTRYILLGESPYPRAASANGYAFWDAAVGGLWSEKGLSKGVNRATSLRNFIKMLLVANGKLAPDETIQARIAEIDKANYVQTLDALFQNLLNEGFLLLNASLALHKDMSVVKANKIWQKFTKKILEKLDSYNIKLILFGRLAEQLVSQIESAHYRYVQAEHPYNLSFIANQTVQDFFRPFHLLKDRKKHYMLNKTEISTIV